MDEARKIDEDGREYYELEPGIRVLTKPSMADVLEWILLEEFFTKPLLEEWFTKHPSDS